jgi:hypothetical protein
VERETKQKTENRKPKSEITAPRKGDDIARRLLATAGDVRNLLPAPRIDAATRHCSAKRVIGCECFNRRAGLHQTTSLAHSTSARS